MHLRDLRVKYEVADIIFFIFAEHDLGGEGQGSAEDKGSRGALSRRTGPQGAHW
jgi:hypothetical protein